MDEKVKGKKQLGLGLHFPKFGSLNKFKQITWDIEKKFTVLPFWRNGILWTYIISYFGFSILSGLQILKLNSKISPKVPLLYDVQKESWMIFPKEFIWLFPVLILAAGFVNTSILKRSYYMNKNMTIMICILLTIGNFLAWISLNEILMLSTK